MLIAAGLILSSSWKSDRVGALEKAVSNDVETEVAPKIKKFRLQILPPKDSSETEAEMWLGEAEAINGDRICPWISVDPESYLYYVVVSPNKQSPYRIVLPRKGPKLQFKEVMKGDESSSRLGNAVWQLDEGKGFYGFVMLVSKEPIANFAELIADSFKDAVIGVHEFDGTWIIDANSISWTEGETRGLLESPESLDDFQATLVQLSRETNSTFEAIGFWLSE